MNIETVKVPVGQLTRGMQVVKLDRPWLETPFKLQGFRIESDAELNTLRRLCEHVYVDVERSAGARRVSGERVVLNERGDVVRSKGGLAAAARSVRPGRGGGRGERVSSEARRPNLPPPVEHYAIASSFDEELPHALAASSAAKHAVRDCVRALKHGGHADLTRVRDSAAALEASMLRNPDAAMLIRTLATDEAFSFRHCVHSAILAIAIGRVLGFRRQRIHELTMGVLLADIGKMRLPKELLQTARRLDARETEIIKLHVRFGLEMIATLRGLSPGAVEVIAAHHERFNGSGYPKGLRGGEIPLHGRIAGLVDSFDAITSERRYAAPIPPDEAVQELYAATEDVFQRELVERLIEVLGPYPVGSVVALSDGAFGLVVARSPTRRLLPVVMLLGDGGAGPGVARRIVDLGADPGPGISVRDIVNPRSHGLDPPTIADFDV